MRLLIVEDDPILSEALIDGLRQVGYAVDATPDGLDAQYLLESNHYDCVLLDVMVPGQDGWSLLKWIRSRPMRTPVLCLTARDSVEDRVRGLDLGADDYLPKPFAWRELQARLRSIIRRSYGRPSSKIIVDDLEIDPVARKVARAGVPIRLTAREYGLLEYLAARQGQIVTRSEIMEHLYDQNDDSMSNVVDVFIGYLRAKVDRGHDRKLIHTKRGLGYVLSVDPVGEGAT